MGLRIEFNSGVGPTCSWGRAKKKKIIILPHIHENNGRKKIECSEICKNVLT